MNSRTWNLVGRPLTAALLLAATLVAAPSTFAQTGRIPDPPEGAWTYPANPSDAGVAPLDAVMPVDPSIIIGELDNGITTTCAPSWRRSATSSGTTCTTSVCRCGR